jgi:hypothetical protein
MKEQIKYREELLEYFNNKLVKSQKEVNSYKNLVEVTGSQLELLKQQEEGDTIEALYSLIKSVNILPIDMSRTNIKNTTERILVMDINYLLPEHKDLSTGEIEELFESKYNCKVLFIDASRANIQGANGYPPIQLL